MYACVFVSVLKAQVGQKLFGRSKEKVKITNHDHVS